MKKLPAKIIEGILRLRHALYDRKILRSYKVDIPVIIIGNLNLGGAGKTPFTEYLIELLSDTYRLAVLSRGYGRKSKGFRLLKEGDGWRESGDEPHQIFRRYGSRVHVAVDADRVHGIRELQRLVRSDIILLDDAFQHRRLASGFRILLTPFNKPFTEDDLFPMGSLRDLPQRAKTADLIVLTKVPDDKMEEASAKKAKIEAMTGKPVLIYHLEHGEPYQGNKSLDWSDLEGKQYVLVTGIANPVPMLDFLSGKNINFVPLLFPDHAEYGRRRLQKIRSVLKKYKARGIITTEKDKQKLEDAGFEPIVVPVRFRSKDEQILKQKIYAYVNSRKFI